MALEDFRTLVDDMVRDKDGVLTQPAVDRAIAAAAGRYSVHFPRRLAVQQTAVAGALQALPPGWQNGFSELLSVEWPVGQSPAATITSRTRLSAAGEQLELEEELPAGALFEVGYTQQHAVDAGTDTVPQPHRVPVATLAASMLCGQLASYYATDGMPTLSADVADHRTKSDRWRSRQRDLEAQYHQALGISAKPAANAGVAAGVVVAPQTPDDDGDGRMFRGRGRR